MLLPPGMQHRSPALHCTNPWCLAVVCMLGQLTHVHIGQVLGSSLSARAFHRLSRYDACEARTLISLLAAAVDIKVYITEAAAGAEGLLLRAGGSLQAATRRVCRTGAIARLASTRSGPAAAVGRTPALGRLAACVAGLFG